MNGCAYMKTKLIIGVLLLSAALLILPAAAADESAPVLPFMVYGSVTYTDGENLPVGTVITATVNGVTSTYTVTEAGKIGGAGTFDEKFLINGTTDGSTVAFKINGLTANAAGGCTFSSGYAKQVALTVEKGQTTGQTTEQTKGPQSPAPILGILAGLGAAAVLFAARQRR